MSEIGRPTTAGRRRVICPICLHPAHRAFRCKQPYCQCEGDAIEMCDAGGPDIDFDLPRGSPEREALEDQDLTPWDDDEQEDEELGTL